MVSKIKHSSMFKMWTCHKDISWKTEQNKKKQCYQNAGDTEYLVFHVQYCISAENSILLLCLSFWEIIIWLMLGWMKGKIPSQQLVLNACYSETILTYIRILSKWRLGCTWLSSWLPGDKNLSHTCLSLSIHQGCVTVSHISPQLQHSTVSIHGRYSNYFQG